MVSRSASAFDQTGADVAGRRMQVGGEEETANLLQLPPQAYAAGVLSSL